MGQVSLLGGGGGGGGPSTPFIERRFGPAPLGLRYGLMHTSFSTPSLLKFFLTSIHFTLERCNILFL